MEGDGRVLTGGVGVLLTSARARWAKSTAVMWGNTMKTHSHNHTEIREIGVCGRDMELGGDC